jgi:tRNA threonylcarbamoyladenosine biosynthesis protein TsaB
MCKAYEIRGFMSSINTVLAIDTALGNCQVALSSGTTILAQEAEIQRNQQTFRLMPMVESVLQKAGLSYAECDVIACTTGPGSFTGIRIGLAAARAMALAAQKPVFPCSTLELLAYQAQQTFPEMPVTSVINAYREELYVQVFDGTLQEAELLSYARFCAINFDPRTIFVGNAPEVVKAHLPRAHVEGPSMPDAAALCRYAYTKQVTLDRQQLIPFYIREPDAKLPVQKFTA